MESPFSASGCSAIGRIRHTRLSPFSTRVVRLELNRPSTDYRHVIEFLFGELPMQPDGLADRHKLWYGVNAATDTLIRDRFGTMVEAAVAGSYRSWEE